MTSPKPVRYCPLAAHRKPMISFLPLLNDYADQITVGQIIYRNLCNSCAHADIPCDPLICEPKLLEHWRWARTTDYTIKGFAGACKLVYREYARDRSQLESRQALALRGMVGNLFDDDRD